MLAPRCALALTLAASACGGAQTRPEPPSGAVDPGSGGLVTPGQHAGAASTPVAPALPANGAPAPAAQGTAEPVTHGKITMTREHCETLGRKFTELTMEQGGMLGELGDQGALEQEAAGVGKMFADRCSREMVGQTVELAEYQCMLRAKAPNDLLGCKR